LSVSSFLMAVRRYITLSNFWTKLALAHISISSMNRLSILRAKVYL
jgi:hypothetical protein